MKFVLEISMVGAAFEEEPYQEIARLLRVIAAKVEGGIDSSPIVDTNGNTAGFFGVEEDES